MVQRKDSQQNQSYKLSILIAQDGLSFCSLNAEENTIEDFYSTTFSKLLDPEQILEELKRAIKFNLSEENLADIKSVHVSYANNLYSLVPQEYFSEDQLTDYLKFNTKILKTDFIAYDELKNLEANCVYIPYTNINNYLFEQFGEFNYNHSSTLFIDTCLAEVKNINKEEVVFVQVQPSRFDICCFKNGKLLLANSFEYFTAEDFIYFVLFTAEQLKLNTENLQLLLSGSIKETDDTYNYLYTYVKEISFFNTSYLTEKINNLSQKAINPKQNLLLLSNLI